MHTVCSYDKLQSKNNMGYRIATLDSATRESAHRAEMPTL